MYQRFQLLDNRQIERTTNTRFYHLLDDPSQFDPDIKVLPQGREDNYVFTHRNGADSHYLLNARYPSIGNEAKRVQLSTDLTDCYDIVFISNGEPNAEEHFERLKSLNLPNRLVWSKDVPGRNEAYKTSARLSKTRYFFAVFAKIEINQQFDFSFGAGRFDYNHYVFRAINPVNGLCYGHQAVILYNKEQVLANPGDQLDFTMAQPYRDIDRVCGVARYNTDPWTTWRTALRETLKLLTWRDHLSIERAGVWMTGEGENADWSIKGATDALNYHTQCNGDYETLRKTYDWSWLREAFKRLYGI